MIECATDNLDLNPIFATDKACGVEAEVVAEVYNIIVRISDRAYRYQNHLVPVGMSFVELGLCLSRIGLQPCLTFIVAVDDEAGDVVVLVAVECAVVRGVERTYIIGQAVLLKEGAHLALAYHE